MVAVPRKIIIDVKEKTIELVTVKRLVYDGKESLTSNIKVNYAPMERMIEDDLHKIPAFIITIKDGDFILDEFKADDFK